MNLEYVSVPDGEHIAYVRYMDDLLILATTRWALRRALRTAYAVLDTLALRVHLHEKRCIGRTARGFDFLGYRFVAGRLLRPSPESLRRLTTRARRLQEQGADAARLRRYVGRWCRWLWAGTDVRVTRKGGLQTYLRFVQKLLAREGVRVAPATPATGP